MRSDRICVRATWLLLGAVAAPGLAQVVSYEADSFPEEAGWNRDETLFPAERWLADGWLFQDPEIVPSPSTAGEEDIYRRSLSDFTGAESFFIEWRMETDGTGEGIFSVAPAALVAGGQTGILYHFTIADDQVRFLRDAFVPIVWVDIEPSVPHTFRLELYSGESYAFYVDGEIADSGIPEGTYPTSDSVTVFGARAAIEDSTTRWDYIRFGAIPEEGSGDYDSDAEVTLEDFYFFHECLSNRRPGINGGPGMGAGPGCRFADFDFDDDVDLLDAAEFQLKFTGD